MSAPRFRGDYDALNQIAQVFAQEADACRQTLRAVKSAKEVLANGDWIGQGATAYYQEMDSSILPTLQRLTAALDNASQVTTKIVAVVRQAEADAAACFKLDGAGAAVAAAGIAAAAAAAVGAAAGAAGAAAGAAAGGAAGAAGAGGAGGTAGPVTSVTPQQAQDIFKNMANQNDIAFNYPNDGCYARAYEMNQRIQQQYGVTPSKVWAFGKLSVDTPGPYGQVNWGYHVASAIPVSQPDGSTQMMVIDPSIGTQPVTPAQWAATMHTTAANTQITAPGSPPINPATGQPAPGSGYWPAADPTTFGGPDGYSAEVMKRYKDAGNRGADATFVPDH